MSDDNALEKREVLVDRIQRFYNENGKLTDAEAEICKRWVSAFALLQKHRNKAVAVKMYLDLHKGKVSVNTAYQDFRNAENIFVPLHKISKDMHRLIIVEQIDNQIEKLETKQKEDGVSESLYANIQHEIDRLLATKVKATGIEHNDPNLPDFSKLQPPKFEINLPPGQMHILKIITQSGVIDLADFRNNIDDAQISE